MEMLWYPGERGEGQDGAMAEEWRNGGEDKENDVLFFFLFGLVLII